MNEEFGVIQWKINGIKVLVKDLKAYCSGAFLLVWFLGFFPFLT